MVRKWQSLNSNLRYTVWQPYILTVCQGDCAKSEPCFSGNLKMPVLSLNNAYQCELRQKQEQYTSFASIIIYCSHWSQYLIHNEYFFKKSKYKTITSHFFLGDFNRMCVVGLFFGGAKDGTQSWYVLIKLQSQPSRFRRQLNVNRNVAFQFLT